MRFTNKMYKSAIRINALSLYLFHVYFTCVPFPVTLCDGITLLVNSKHSRPPPFITSLYRAPQTYDRGKSPKFLNPFIIVSKVRPCYSLENARQFGQLKNGNSLSTPAPTESKKTSDHLTTSATMTPVITTTAVNSTFLHPSLPTSSTAQAQQGVSPSFSSLEFNGNWHIIKPNIKEGHNEQVIKYNKDGTRVVHESVYKYHNRDPQLLQLLKGKNEDKNFDTSTGTVPTDYTNVVHQPNQNLTHSYNSSNVDADPLFFLHGKQQSINTSVSSFQGTDELADNIHSQTESAYQYVNNSDTTTAALETFVNNIASTTTDDMFMKTTSGAPKVTTAPFPASNTTIVMETLKNFTPIIVTVPTRKVQESVIEKLGDGAQNILAQIFKGFMNGRQTTGLFNGKNKVGEDTSNTSTPESVGGWHGKIQNISINDTGMFPLQSESLEPAFPKNTSQSLNHHMWKGDYAENTTITSHFSVGNGSFFLSQPLFFDFLMALTKSPVNVDDKTEPSSVENSSVLHQFNEYPHDRPTESLMNYSNESSNSNELDPIHLILNSTASLGPFTDLLLYGPNTTVVEDSDVNAHVSEANVSYRNNTPWQFSQPSIFVSEDVNESSDGIDNPNFASVTTVPPMTYGKMNFPLPCSDCNALDINETDNSTLTTPFHNTIVTSTSSWRPLWRPPIWPSPKNPPPPLVIQYWLNSNWNDSINWFKGHSFNNTASTKAVSENENNPATSTTTNNDASEVQYVHKNLTENQTSMRYPRLPTYLKDRYVVTTYRPSTPHVGLSPVSWLFGSQDIQPKTDVNSPIINNTETAAIAEQTLEPTPRNDSISLTDFEEIDHLSYPKINNEFLDAKTTINGKFDSQAMEAMRPPTRTYGPNSMPLDEMKEKENNTEHLLQLIYLASEQSSDPIWPFMTNVTNSSNFKVPYKEDVIIDQDLDKADENGLKIDETTQNGTNKAQTHEIITEISKLYSKLTFGINIPYTIIQPLLLSKISMWEKPDLQ